MLAIYDADDIPEIMDFDNLLSAHAAPAPVADWGEDALPEGYVKSSIDQDRLDAAARLDQPLSSSRETGPRDSNSSGRRGGRPGRGRKGGRRGRDGQWQPTREGEASFSRSDDGVLKFEYQYGSYVTPLPFSLSESDVANALFVKFSARCANDLTIGLSSSANPVPGAPLYEVVVGGWNDSKSVVRTHAQGAERAISTTKRTCSSSEFRNYWIGLVHNTIRVGFGDEIGKRLLLSWTNDGEGSDLGVPFELTQIRHVGFTNWDKTLEVKDVTLEKADESVWKATADDAMDDDAFVPDYVKNVNEELMKARTRATKFGTEATEPTLAQMHERGAISFTDFEHAKHATDGFQTGFDVFTEEEKAKRLERASRFGVTSDDTYSKDAQARQARLERFGVDALQSGKLLVESVTQDPEKTGVPPVKLPSEADLVREDALYLYGGLFKSGYVVTRELMQLFDEYGPSHVEWVNDCSANVVFSDPQSAKRALMNETDELPQESEGKTFPQALKSFRYTFVQPKQPLLVRFATATDVKDPNGSKFRTLRIHRRAKARRRALPKEQRLDSALSSSRDRRTKRGRRADSGDDDDMVEAPAATKRHRASSDVEDDEL